MKWLIIVATCFCFALGYEENLECSENGPKYWCKDLKTAQKCQAQSYCSQHVWSKKLKNSGLCTECQQYVGTVHLLLSSNSTQAEVLAAMKSVCTLLPTTVRSYCSSAVDLYGKQLVQMLVQYTAQPKQFCSLIGLCNSTTNHLITKQFIKKLHQIHINKVNTDYCLTCQQYVGTIHLLISNNATKAELLAGLKSMCGLLPTSISSECNVVVEMFGSKLVDELVAYTADPSKFCKLIGLCKSSHDLVHQQDASQGVARIHRNTLIQHSQGVKLPKNAVTCEVCTIAMGYLDNELKGNKTQAAVENALKYICTLLPSSLKSECDDLVNQYAPAIVQLIVAELANPSTVCKELGLCSTAEKYVPVKSVVQKVDSAVTCEVCEYAMQYLDSLINQKSTKDEVKAALDSLCSYLPSTYKSECTSLVNTYSDQIINLIVDELKDASQICKTIRLCGTKQTSRKEVPVKSVVQKVDSAVTCEVCEYAMQYLDSLINQKSTKDEVKAALDSLCSYLPSTYKSECTSLVNTYSDQIINLIVNELKDASQICKLIGLCGTKQTLNKVKDSVPCDICEAAMAELEGLLSQPTTEAEVKALLSTLCTKLPSSIATECKTLVNAYTDEIVKFLVEEMGTPKAFCTKIKLCAAAKKLTASYKSSNGVTCTLCQYAMGELDAVLKENSTEAEIQAAVDGLCSKLPSSLSAECKLLVNEYGNAIVTLLVQALDPSVICKELGLCTSQKTSQQSQKSIKAKKYMLGLRFPIKGVSCEICEYAMGYLDSILENKSTKKEIESAVEGLCAHLPSAIKNECDALITQYGDNLIDLLVAQIKPALICKELKLC